MYDYKDQIGLPGKNQILERQMMESGLHLAFDPVSAVIGTGLSIISGVMGASAGAKKDAANKEAVKEQNRYNKENWKRSDREREDDYRWNVRAVQTAQHNSDSTAAYRDEVNLRAWGDENALIDWEHQQAQLAYEGGIEEAAEQLEYNIFSEGLALREQDLFLHESIADLTWKNEDLVAQLTEDMAQIDVQINEVNRTYTKDAKLLGEDRNELNAETTKQIGMITEARAGITAQETKRVEDTAVSKQLITERRDKELDALVRNGERLSNAGVKSRDTYNVGRLRQLHELKGKEATTVEGLQKSRIASLKATGEAAALGQAGRSARRNLQSVLMEHALHQSALSSSLGRDISLFNIEDQALLNAYNFEREDRRISIESNADVRQSTEDMAALETRKVVAEDLYGATMEGVKRTELDTEETFVNEMKRIGDRRITEQESFISDIKDNTIGGLESAKTFKGDAKTDAHARYAVKLTDLNTKDAYVRDEIAHDKLAADTAALKMIGSEPVKPPYKTEPNKMPRTKFMQPRLPEKLVKPGKAVSVGNANFLSGAAAGVGALASTVAGADWGP